MQKVSEEIYSRIDNGIYNENGNRWWQPDSLLNLLRTLYNPFRIEYSRRIFERFKIDPEEMSALEVGCGGGLLSEEIAKMGFVTTGIDPSRQSLQEAITHSQDNNLNINYVEGTGEDLPFQNMSFDVVFCCDVLEHVRDLPKVISEISRVLKKGGIFIYDTFNRTYLSKISMIKIFQEWSRWAIMPPDLHVWEMFIKPDELKSLLEENNMIWKEHRGIAPNISKLKMLNYLRKRAVGKLSYEEFGKKFIMVEGRNTRFIYVGYAIKNIIPD
jgi:2-polyprenyl-6-hydroxyphenyl methylase/3-demethylubiquinone-9 3-methyltransferase